MGERADAEIAARGRLTRLLDRTAPGIQYIVVDAERVVFEFAGGWAGVAEQRRMSSATTLMAYSMTKPFTALAVLQLVERGQIRLDRSLMAYLKDCPYPQTVTIRQLISHTSGIPSPVPLRWVHLAEAHATFDERAALAAVLRRHSKLASAPGRRYRYSNIGYWLLGMVIEAVTRTPYVDVVREQIFEPLGLHARDIGFVIASAREHAHGYLERASILNLLRPWLTDAEVWGRPEGRWLRVNDHYLNGPAFGGMIGPARSFAVFLRDQLADESVLIRPETKAQFYARQRSGDGAPIAMTLGWHIGVCGGDEYFFKEGGGAGFHSEMRIYPRARLGSVIMVNGTRFDSNSILSRLDASFLMTS